MKQGSTPLSHSLLLGDTKARQTVWQRQNFYSVSTLLLLAGAFAGCAQEPEAIAVAHKGNTVVIHHRSVANGVLTDRIEVVTPTGVSQTVLHVAGVTDARPQVKPTPSLADKEAAAELKELGAEAQ
jgi:hypothetical protein